MLFLFLFSHGIGATDSLLALLHGHAFHVQGLYNKLCATLYFLRNFPVYNGWWLELAVLGDSDDGLYKIGKVELVASS